MEEVDEEEDRGLLIPLLGPGVRLSPLAPSTSKFEVGTIDCSIAPGACSSCPISRIGDLSWLVFSLLIVSWFEVVGGC